MEVQQGLNTLCNASAACFNVSRNGQGNHNCANARRNLTIGAPVQPSYVCYGTCRTLLNDVLNGCGEVGILHSYS